uniref:Uncharacterized protein n=1 Tax=Ditylenchus dipsaci TaxID=166011 RepID=A0A915CYK0_9BILA
MYSCWLALLHDHPKEEEHLAAPAIHPVLQQPVYWTAASTPAHPPAGVKSFSLDSLSLLLCCCGRLHNCWTMDVAAGVVASGLHHNPFLHAFSFGEREDEASD